MKNILKDDSRLGLPVPGFHEEWDTYSLEEQQSILLQWEKIRGAIPDRIEDLERLINIKQDQLSLEEDFSVSCVLNTEIAELASIINDLWLWYRTDQSLSGKVHM